MTRAVRARTASSHRRATARGVPARLLGVILVPVLVLSVVLGSDVAAGRRDVRRAADVADRATALRELAHLRSALFRERLAKEIFTRAGDPPTRRWSRRRSAR